MTTAEAADAAAADAENAAGAADDAAFDAEAAAAAADAAAADAEAAVDSAGDATVVESREPPAASFDADANNCPVGTPVDCRDGTCASSIYACRASVPVSDATLPPEATEEASETALASTVDADEEGENEQAVNEGCATSAPGTATTSAVGLIALATAAYAASRLRRRRARPAI